MQDFTIPMHLSTSGLCSSYPGEPSTSEVAERKFPMLVDLYATFQPSVADLDDSAVDFSLVTAL
jgi:hypothetical protein